MGMFSSISNAVSSSVSVIDKSMSGLGATLNIYAREQYENDKSHELVSKQRLHSKVIDNLTDAGIRMAHSKERAESANLKYEAISKEAEELINSIEQ